MRIYKIANVIPPEKAEQLNTNVELPKNKHFLDAVRNTQGAKITDKGLELNLVRRQKPEQEGEESARTGIFYLPEGDENKKFYSKPDGWHGGEQEIKGTTLLRKPLFVKGGTGGKAPEMAFILLRGREEWAELNSKVNRLINELAWDKTNLGELLDDIIQKYGIDKNIKRLLTRAISFPGNAYSHAIRECVIAHVVRQAGYDSVLGYSFRRTGQPFISEIFDIREMTFPSNVLEPRVHEIFLKKVEASTQKIADSDHIYSKQEMISMGADGGLSDAILINIPLSLIDGRDPTPIDYVDESGAVKSFTKGNEIKVPIEVEWNGNNFMLYGGNHRVRQAEVNGQDEIQAFVHCEDIDEYQNLIREFSY